MLFSVRLPINILIIIGLVAFFDCVNSSNSFRHPNLPKDDINNIDVSENSFWEPFENYNNINNKFEDSWITSNITHSKTNKKIFPSKWRLGKAKKIPGFIDDSALVLKDKGDQAMIGHILENPIKIDGNSKLVVQYEVKLQNELKCGGAFMKLYPPMSKEDLLNYGSKKRQLQQYQIVFGPDKCLPGFNGIKFGLNRKNPITEEYQLKQLQFPPVSKLENDFKSHLYTLLIDSMNQNFEIRIDGQVYIASSLIQDGLFLPKFTPSKLIRDYEVEKPQDWDDRILIPDPNASKPEDWDDEAPYWIPDPKSLKPQEWDESIPEYIPEPNRYQPAWWNSKIDGEWIAPIIKNPSCYTNYGCGKWEVPMIINKNYKEKWEPPMIKNENYMGKWEPDLIDNPEHYKDEQPSIFDNEVGTLVFEFISGSSNLMIDNIYIGDSVQEAEMIGNLTFIPKHNLEAKEISLNNEKLLNKNRQPINPGISSTVNQETDNLFDKLFDSIFDFLEGGNVSSMNILSILMSIVIMLVLKKIF